MCSFQALLFLNWILLLVVVVVVKRKQMRKVKYRLPTSNVHCPMQVLFYISKANNSKHFLGKDEEDGQALLQAPLPIERKQNSIAKKTNHQ